MKNSNPSRKITRLLSNYNKLNDLGKKEDNKRVAELTEISKYININRKEKFNLAAHNDGLEMDEEW